MSKAVFAAVLVLAGVAAVAAYGNCTTYTEWDGVLNTDGPAKKFCSQCQWGCLTDLRCTNITFADDGLEDGEADVVTLSKAELATFDCMTVDPHVNSTDWTDATDSPGLCVLYDNSTMGFEQFGPTGIFDVQEQDCEACMQQCFTDAKCTGFVYNFVAYGKVNTPEICPEPIFKEPLV